MEKIHVIMSPPSGGRGTSSAAGFRFLLSSTLLAPGSICSLLVPLLSRRCLGRQRVRASFCQRGLVNDHKSSKDRYQASRIDHWQFQAT